MGVTIGGAVDLGDDIAACLAHSDVVVDFSSHQATRSVLELAVANHKAVVLGTTGHAAEEKKQLLALAAHVPCVWAGNFSVGVNLLFALTRRAAACWPPTTTPRSSKCTTVSRRTHPAALPPDCSRLSWKSAN